MKEYQIHLKQVSEVEGRDRLARAVRLILDHARPVLPYITQETIESFSSLESPLKMKEGDAT